MQKGAGTKNLMNKYQNASNEFFLTIFITKFFVSFSCHGSYSYHLFMSMMISLRAMKILVEG